MQLRVIYIFRIITFWNYSKCSKIKLTSSSSHTVSLCPLSSQGFTFIAPLQKCFIVLLFYCCFLFTFYCYSSANRVMFIGILLFH